MALIVISGKTSSGKTVLSKKLAPLLNYKELYMGERFIKLAEERGFPNKAALYEAMEREPDLEREMDRAQAEEIQFADNKIVQGRITPFIVRGLIPGLPVPSAKAICFLLDVEPYIGAIREKNVPANRHLSLEEVIALREKRLQTERHRYYELYGIADHLDKRYFDEVIDTSNLTEDEVLKEALSRLKLHGVV